MVLIGGLLLTAGCTAISVEDGVTPPVMTTPAATVPVTTQPMNDESTPRVTDQIIEGGEVPRALLDTILVDLLNRTGATMNDVILEKSEAIVWNDGSLGCPQPDVMYTQALVNGYQIIFVVEGNTFDYHVSERGNFILCDSAQPSNMPQGTPSE